jgi:hypothetical protein
MARAIHTATLLASGDVLIVGGDNAPGAEIYNPASGTFASTGATGSRSAHTATLLGDGTVLIAGGGDESEVALSSAEIYVPTANPITGCGPFPTVNGLCRRIAILPWLAAIQGQWETDVTLSTDVATYPSPAGSGPQPVVFGYQLFQAAHSSSANMLVTDNDQGTRIADGISGISSLRTNPYVARILGGIDCSGGCHSDANAAVGSLGISIDGPSVDALNRSRASVRYKLLRADGSVIGQTDVPVIFQDQASNRWRSAVTETPLSQQAKPGAVVMAMAVANLSATPQAVVVKLFDRSGNFVASAKTAVLDGAFPNGTEGGTGGVQAFTLSQFLGAELAPNSGSAEFRGTVTLEGEAGGTIAPVILRTSIPSLVSITPTPE